MKNLLLILILANVLYWMWGAFTVEDPQPGVVVIQEGDLGPPLDVTAARDRETVASVGAVLGSGEPSALDAIVGRSCVTIGPFREDTDADSAVLVHHSEGMRTALRTERATLFVGHWVQIRDVANDAAAKEILKKLAAEGLTDAYLVRTEDEGLKISLGLFGNVERAQKIEAQAKALDLHAEVAPRTAERTVSFVDIGLPPGKGASAIVEKYGEDMVLLRGQATCPK